MKKFKMLLLILPLIFFVSGCTPENNDSKKEEAKSTSSPLLFEVTKEGSDNKLYLFGSIHAAEASMYPLPDYVLNAYKESDAIAVEFDLVAYNQDLEGQMESLKNFINPNGESVSKYLGEETYNKAKTILEKAHLYNSMYDLYNVVMWFSLMENASMADAEIFSTFGIDNHILTKAKDDKKEIIELESPEFQTDLLLNMDSKIMLTLINEMVDNYDEEVDELKKLYEAYKKGDRENLEAMFKGDEEETKDLGDYNKLLITDRNKGMFAKLDQYFKDGKKVFCTVGLAHIIGGESIIELLEGKGYTIKQIK